MEDEEGGCVDMVLSDRSYKIHICSNGDDFLAPSQCDICNFMNMYQRDPFYREPGCVMSSSY